MEITAAIIHKFCEYERTIISEIQKLESASLEIEEKISYIEEENSDIIERYNNNKDLFEDVFRFMDYIGVEREALPFKKDEIDQNHLNELQKKREELTEYQDKMHQLIRMYKNYLVLIGRIKKDEDIDEYRTDAIGCYNSFFEYSLDIYQMNKSALSYWDQFRADNYAQYIKVVDTFTFENMCLLKHPSCDDSFNNGIGELVITICRASWEYKYLSELCDHWQCLNNLKKKHELRIIQKREKNNVIMRYWDTDTRLIDQSKYTDSEFYKIYRQIINSRLEAEIQSFLEIFR